MSMRMLIAAAVLVGGLVLMGTMMATEGEPGGVPLILVVAGAIGVLLARRHRRRGGRQGTTSDF